MKNKTCSICGKTFKCFPSKESLTAVFDTKDFEIRWNFKNILRKTDRALLVDVEDIKKCDVALCLECYQKILQEMTERIKNNRTIDI